MCQVTIVPRVNASVTYGNIIFFVQFSSYIRYFCSIQSLYSLFLFNLVPNFVKIEPFNF